MDSNHTDDESTPGVTKYMKYLIAKLTIATAAAVGLLAIAVTPALAQNDVQFTIVAEQEVVEIDSNGKKRIRTVPAETVVPGEEVIYTIFFKNTSNTALGNIAVTDPIPSDMRYIAGSAFGSGTSISYSVDGGNNYGQPTELQVQERQTGRVRMARPDDYTHIKWLYQNTLKPSDKAFVSFKAVLK